MAILLPNSVGQSGEAKFLAPKFQMNLVDGSFWPFKMAVSCQKKFLNVIFMAAIFVKTSICHCANWGSLTFWPFLRGYLAAIFEFKKFNVSIIILVVFV